MNRDEIIAMANTAAMQHGHTYEPEAADGTIEFLGSFAALVAAKEREACAQVCDGIEIGEGETAGLACECAAAIRARGTREGA